MPTRPFQRIAATIREQIRTGALEPGALIPSVRELSRQHDVAMATAQHAMRVLQADGLVRSERGVGNMVTAESERGWSASMWVQRSRRPGRVYPPGQHASIVGAEVVPAPTQVAAALGLDDGDEVIKRDRVIYEGDVAVSASTSWFPARIRDVAPDLLVAERLPDGSFTYLAVRLGRRVASWHDLYDPDVATAAEAELLGIAEGTSIHRGRNWVYDEQDDVLEYGESISTARIAYAGRLEV